MSRHGCRSSLAGALAAPRVQRAAGLLLLSWIGLGLAGACHRFDDVPMAGTDRGAPVALGSTASVVSSPAASLGLTQTVERSLPAPTPDAEPRPERGKPSVVWRFRSAAPVSGSAAVSRGGLVYVATVEGYVHALEPDGAFRWSYGLVGMPVGAPAVDPAGRVYVATSAQRLYALLPDGRMGWMQRAPTRFATPPVWAAPGLILYAGRDRNLYTVTEWNAPPQRQHLGHAASVDLASLGDGVVAVSTSAADAQVYHRSSLVARLALDGEPAQPLLGGRDRWYAVTREGIAAFDRTSREPAWKAPAERAALSADERVLIVQREHELVWLSPQSGVEQRRARLPGDVSAPPAVTNAGVAVVPLVSGSLVVIEPRQGRMARIKLGAAPAWSPVWSELSRRVIAASAGVVVGVDLSAWSTPGSPNEADAEPSPAPPPVGNEGRPDLGSSRGAHDPVPGGA